MRSDAPSPPPGDDFQPEPTYRVTTAAALRRELTVAPPEAEAEALARTRREVRFSKGALAAQGLRTHTCPQCGVNPAGPAKSRTLVYVPSWVYIGLFVNFFLLLILYLAGRKSIDVDVTLCPDCRRSETRARWIRGVSVLGLLAFPLLGAYLGGALGDTFMGAASGVVASLVGMLAAHVHTRHDLLTVKKIDRDSVTLLGTGHLDAVVEREAPDLKKA